MRITNKIWKVALMKNGLPESIEISSICFPEESYKSAREYTERMREHIKQNEYTWCVKDPVLVKNPYPGEPT